MPGYYVPKKNRCYNTTTGATSCFSPPAQLFFAVNSSKQNDLRQSKTVNYVETNQDNNPSAVTMKGEGNLRKKGSGGNSYANYLARKKGNIYCNCNTKKIQTTN